MRALYLDVRLRALFFGWLGQFQWCKPGSWEAVLGLGWSDVVRIGDQNTTRRVQFRPTRIGRKVQDSSTGWVCVYMIFICVYLCMYMYVCIYIYIYTVFVGVGHLMSVSSEAPKPIYTPYPSVYTLYDVAISSTGLYILCIKAYVGYRPSTLLGFMSAHQGNLAWEP